MGYPVEEARGALRFSLGRTTTAAEIAEAADVIVRTLAHLREAAAEMRLQRVTSAVKVPGPDPTVAEAPLE
jgi:Cdc6-like AAA superfamily ATPase